MEHTRHTVSSSSLSSAFFSFPRHWCEMAAVVAARWLCRTRSPDLPPALSRVAALCSSALSKRVEEEPEGEGTKGGGETVGGEEREGGGAAGRGSRVPPRLAGGLLPCSTWSRRLRASRGLGSRVRGTGVASHARERKLGQPCPLVSMEWEQPASRANIRYWVRPGFGNLPSKHLQIWVEPTPTHLAPLSKHTLRVSDRVGLDLLGHSFHILFKEKK